MKLLAVVLALLLISGALAIRNAVHDDGDGDEKVEADDEVKAVGEDDQLVLGCVSELMDICKRMDSGVEGVDKVVLADPGTVADVATAERLDAWLTFDPWPVAEASPDNVLFEEETIPVAEDTIGLVISKPYAERLDDSCSADSLIRCTAEATASDGTAKLGVGDPGSALGGILLTAALTEIVGTPELSLANVEEQRGLLATVLGTMPDHDQLGARMLVDEDAPMAVISREGQADDYVQSDEGAQKRLEFEPTKVEKRAIKVRVVLALTPGADRGDLENVVDIETDTPSIFEENGWRNNPSEDDTGLPAGDILLALVQEHQR